MEVQMKNKKFLSAVLFSVLGVASFLVRAIKWKDDLVPEDAYSATAGFLLGVSLSFLFDCRWLYSSETDQYKELIDQTNLKSPSRPRYVIENSPRCTSSKKKRIIQSVALLNMLIGFAGIIYRLFATGKEFHSSENQDFLKSTLLTTLWFFWSTFIFGSALQVGLKERILKKWRPETLLTVNNYHIFYEPDGKNVRNSKVGVGKILGM